MDNLRSDLGVCFQSLEIHKTKVETRKKQIADLLAENETDKESVRKIEEKINEVKELLK